MFPAAPAPAPAPSSDRNDLVILLPSILGAVLLTALVLGLGSWWYMRRHRQARKDLENSLQVRIDTLSTASCTVQRETHIFRSTRRGRTPTQRT